jgi:hypothetical protein
MIGTAGAAHPRTGSNGSGTLSAAIARGSFVVSVVVSMRRPTSSRLAPVGSC